MRGRDIKRYSYEFADLWLINVHNGIKENGIKPVEIDDYPSIKEYLDRYSSQLKKRADKGDTFYNLRNCAYMEDFYKQKIIYPDIMRMPSKVELLNDYPFIYLDDNEFYVEATNFMITGNHVDYIYLFLVSDVGFYTFSKFYTGPQFDATGFRYKKAYLEEAFVPLVKREIINSINKLNKFQCEKKVLGNTNNQIWFDLMGLNDEEISHILNYKEELLKHSK